MEWWVIWEFWKCFWKTREAKHRAVVQVKLNLPWGSRWTKWPLRALPVFLFCDFSTLMLLSHQLDRWPCISQQIRQMMEDGLDEAGLDFFCLHSWAVMLWRRVSRLHAWPVVVCVPDNWKAEMSPCKRKAVHANTLHFTAFTENTQLPTLVRDTATVAHIPPSH